MSIGILDILTIWPPFSTEEFTPPVVSATLLSAIRALLADIPGLDAGDRIRAGDAGGLDFPFVLIDQIRADETLNSKNFYEEDYMFQVTAASLDPDDAEAIGKEARSRLMPRQGATKLLFDDGFEIWRRPRGRREYSQAGAGPDGATVFYYQFDFTIYVDRTK